MRYDWWMWGGYTIFCNFIFEALYLLDLNISVNWLWPLGIHKYDYVRSTLLCHSQVNRKKMRSRNFGGNALLVVMTHHIHSFCVNNDNVTFSWNKKTNIKRCVSIITSPGKSSKEFSTFFDQIIIITIKSFYTFFSLERGRHLHAFTSFYIIFHHPCHFLTYKKMKTYHSSS